eukprot:g20364.t1
MSLPQALMAHFYFLVVFGVVYVIFTIIYYAAGGRNENGKPYIYKALDYGNDLTTAIINIVVINFIVCPLLYSLQWFMWAGVHAATANLHNIWFAPQPTRPTSTTWSRGRSMRTAWCVEGKCVDKAFFGLAL